MERHYGTAGIPLVECINPWLQKYRVRWNYKQKEDDENQVSFVETEFAHRPTPEEIESAIAQSAVDASDNELKQMATLLECPDFAERMEQGRQTRIQSDPLAQMLELQREANLARTDISDEVALLVPNTFINFKETCTIKKEKKELAKGAIIRYDNKLWRVVQTHTPQAQYPPSMDTASLYAIIDVKHVGTEDDPIPYTQGMSFEAGKYYTQYGVLYYCILTTETGYPNDLKDLPTIVKKEEQEEKTE